MSFRVMKILDKNTVEVSPKWVFFEKRGNRVRISELNSVNLKNLNLDITTQNLEKALLGKRIGISGKSLTSDSLLASITTQSA